MRFVSLFHNSDAGVRHFRVRPNDRHAARTSSKLSRLPARIRKLREASAKASRCNSEHAPGTRERLDGSRIRFCVYKCVSERSFQGHVPSGRPPGERPPGPRRTPPCFSQITGAGAGTKNNFQCDKQQAERLHRLLLCPCLDRELIQKSA